MLLCSVANLSKMEANIWTTTGKSTFTPVCRNNLFPFYCHTPLFPF